MEEPVSCAMKPMMEKMTNPAKMLVPQLRMGTMSASLRKRSCGYSAQLNALCCCIVWRFVAKPVAVVVESIERSHCDDCSPARPNRVEDLHCRLTPNLSAIRKAWRRVLSCSKRLVNLSTSGGNLQLSREGVQISAQCRSECRPWHPEASHRARAVTPTPNTEMSPWSKQPTYTKRARHYFQGARTIKNVQKTLDAMA